MLCFRKNVGGKEERGEREKEGKKGVGDWMWGKKGETKRKRRAKRERERERERERDFYCRATETR